PMIDPSTRMVRLRAYTSNSDHSLTPGSFAHIQVDFKITENAILIPTQSVIPILKGKKVFISKNGKADEKIIETGERTADMIEVTSGLTAGDTVLTTGILQVRKGSDVKFSEVK
ncbi:MAG TPA: efflux RND transporter periplasmic adaptor subunit, partial [Bacteroidia bacterium]|nr:efflux RND transporter periplasmic adaptor subunit [Bacteroidia bacterium]